jgi:hypothetical protein
MHRSKQHVSEKPPARLRCAIWVDQEAPRDINFPKESVAMALGVNRSLK